MTQLLKKAFDEASKLPAEEQDALARTLLEQLASEAHWPDKLAATEDVLAELADEALSEFRSGKTETLNPDEL